MTTLFSGLSARVVRLGVPVVAVPDQRDYRTQPESPTPPPLPVHDALTRSIRRADELDDQHRERLARLECERVKQGGRPS